MCGIFGCVGPNSNAALNSSVFFEVMKHRGPDGRGYYHNDRFAAGHLRLEIVGGEQGHQPLQSSNGDVFLFNGELYNFKDLALSYLKREYESDSKVAFELMQKYGPSILQHFRGMFAFAYWKSDSNELILGRDFFGMKPLFFSNTGEHFYFSSELLPLAASLKSSTVEQCLAEMSLFGNSRPGTTIFSGIEELKPAELLIFSKERITRQRYLKIGKYINSRKKTDKEEFFTTFEKVCNRHYPDSHIPAVCLSGGMDSASIAVALSRFDKSFQCYTLGYKDPAFDESGMADKIAGILDKELIHVPYPEMDESSLKQCVSSMDGPLGDMSWFPTWNLAKRIAKSHKVAISGDGGDELLFGYPVYMAEAMLQHVPDFVTSLTGKLSGLFGKVSRKRVGLREKLLRFSWGCSFSTLRRHASFMMSAAPDYCDFWDEYEKSLYENALEEEVNPESSWELTCYYYYRIYLANVLLLKTDRAFMSHSVEVRNPFLDLDLLELFCLPETGFPVSMKPKQFLRDYLEMHLGKGVMNFSKRGFSAPAHELSNQLRGLCGMSSQSTPYPYYDSFRAISKLQIEFCNSLMQTE
jgi:asparagine synthase (glutamine-hydrolysing)